MEKKGWLNSLRNFFSDFFSSNEVYRAKLNEEARRQAAATGTLARINDTLARPLGMLTTVPDAPNPFVVNQRREPVSRDLSPIEKAGRRSTPVEEAHKSEHQQKRLPFERDGLLRVPGARDTLDPFG